MQDSPFLGLANIIDLDLESITFVSDYVQIHFRDVILTAITRPHVISGGDRYAWEDEGFRDALCGQIGKRVRRAFDIDSVEIRIELADGDAIVISLLPEDYRAAEAVILNFGPNTPNTVSW